MNPAKPPSDGWLGTPQILKWLCIVAAVFRALSQQSEQPAIYVLRQHGFFQWGTEGRCGYFISRNESWDGSSLSFRRGRPCAWSADLVLVVALVSRAFPLRLFLRFHTTFGSDGSLPPSPRIQASKARAGRGTYIPPCGGGPRISRTTFQTSKFQFPNIHLFKILSAPHPSIHHRTTRKCYSRADNKKDGAI